MVLSIYFQACIVLIFFPIHKNSLWGNNMGPVGVQALEKYLKYWIKVQELE